MSDDADDETGERKARSLSNLEVLRFVWRLWMRQRGRFAGLVAFSALATASDLTTPVLSGRLVDALASGPATAEHRAWVAYAVFLSASVAFYICRQSAFRFFEIPMTSKNMELLYTEAFARVQRFSADWHANTFGGSIVRRITRAGPSYDMATGTILLGLGPTLCVLLGLSLYMLFTWVWIGVYALAVVLAFMATSITLSARYIRPQNQISNARDSAIGAALADAISGNAVVKSFGAETREEARFAGVVRAWRDATAKTWHRFVDVWLAQIAAVLALQAGLVGFLMTLWVQGKASPGDVAFAITAFMLMAGYLRRFGEEVQTLQKSLDQIEDVALYMRTPQQIADRPNAAPFIPGPEGSRGSIVFDRVSFGYQNQGAPIYEDFSLEILPGERVALVGPTGSGKSTFVKLLQRLYDVDGGVIRVDGQDVRAVTQASLRRAIALVPQDPALFHRSIADNIAYGRSDAEPAQIEAASVRAHAHGFVTRLPRGYDTLVGERGVKLSGGERQRVAIARALLADAPILVLDEATSSLDTETESEVQAAMHEVMEGRTTIVIAHRLSTIRTADRILVFDQGRVVEQGAHAALVKRGGVYARLHALAAAEA
jgi:ATP-binding cassette subfamily B protein